MNERDEEQSEGRRPRVVDKRVSTGGSPSDRAEQGPTTEGAAAEGPTQHPPPDEEKSAQGPLPDRSEPSSTGEAPAPGGDPEAERVWTPEQEAEARRLAEEMARIPALDWVANAAVTLVNVAATKLDRGDVAEARLAIDALAALLSGVGDRLGEVQAPLRETLAQLQMAYANRTTAAPGQQNTPKGTAPG